ncbi:MAG: hypothetical protein ACRDPD_30055 [Streptosporangiaceae bacterium]
MPETTPAQNMMNKEFDRLRAALARMNPDAAEVCRLDLVRILRLLVAEAGKYPRTPSLPLHPMYDALGLEYPHLDPETAARIDSALARAYTRDLT